MRTYGAQNGLNSRRDQHTYRDAKPMLEPFSCLALSKRAVAKTPELSRERKTGLSVGKQYGKVWRQAAVEAGPANYDSLHRQYRNIFRDRRGAVCSTRI